MASEPYCAAAPSRSLRAITYTPSPLPRAANLCSSSPRIPSFIVISIFRRRPSSRPLRKVDPLHLSFLARAYAFPSLSYSFRPCAHFNCSECPYSLVRFCSRVQREQRRESCLPQFFLLHVRICLHFRSERQRLRFAADTEFASGLQPALRDWLQTVHLLQQSIGYHKLAIAIRSLLCQRLCHRAMSTYSLAEAITPSRKAVPPRKAAKGRKGGDIELPDYISPEPKNAAERRDWDRMSSRMEGEHYLLLWLRQGVSMLNRHFSFAGFHTYCQSASMWTDKRQNE